MKSLLKKDLREYTSFKHQDILHMEKVDKFHSLKSEWKFFEKEKLQWDFTKGVYFINLKLKSEL